MLDGTIFGGGPPNGPAAKSRRGRSTTRPSTKWLAFEATGSSYGFRFAGGQQHAVNGYTITSANDAPNRDPYSWTLSGSNDGVNYTIVDTRSAQTFLDAIPDAALRVQQQHRLRILSLRFQNQVRRHGPGVGSAQRERDPDGRDRAVRPGARGFRPAHQSGRGSRLDAGHETSVYQRVEFDVADPASIVSLMLEMQYDDGFVAYLNGKRVAAVHAPRAAELSIRMPPANAITPSSLVPQSFDLTPHLGELVAGTNVLAIHVLNIDDASQDLLSRPRLMARQLIDDTLIPVYMTDPIARCDEQRRVMPASSTRRSSASSTGSTTRRFS